MWSAVLYASAGKRLVASTWWVPSGSVPNEVSHPLPRERRRYGNARGLAQGQGWARSALRHSRRSGAGSGRSEPDDEPPVQHCELPLHRLRNRLLSCDFALHSLVSVRSWYWERLTLPDKG